MGQLIDDLLELSRLARTQMRRESVDLSALARTIAHDLDRDRAGRAVEFVIPETFPADRDERLLEVALRNLLNNARKFSSGEPHPRVEFGATEENGLLLYHVRDNGVGFDPAYSDKLFGVFQRLHAPEEFEGTGMGLATVQRVVERHGGRVWAEGTVNGGPTVYFTLPPRIGRRRIRPDARQGARRRLARQDPLLQSRAPVLHPLPDPGFLVALLGNQGAAPGAPSVHKNLDFTELAAGLGRGRRLFLLRHPLLDFQARSGESRDALRGDELHRLLPPEGKLELSVDVPAAY
jgi:histidine kinase/DNA gyrase B/HSP90-like ATPase